MGSKILVVDDEESIRYTFESFLSEEGHEVTTAKSFEEAVVCIEGTEYDIIFTDIVLAGKTGIDLLREARGKGLECPFIIITGYPTVETASESLRLGAFDYIRKPVTQKILLRVASMALKHKDLMDQNKQYRANLDAIFRSVKDGIITVDKEMKVIEMNRGAEALCGYSRNDAMNKPVPALLRGCLQKCVNALSVAVTERRAVEVSRIECRHIDRPEQVVTISVSPLIDTYDEFSGAVMVLKDETHIVALEADMKERYQFHRMIGRSEAMQKVYALIDQLADYRTTVLVRGESGTGKELVAEAIHYQGVRSSGPLVKVNCAALPENLLESELFGHVKGAFTGAIKDKAGRFQRADGGTIFLDEIGDIPKPVQMRLLRVLQEMEFERVGDSSPLKVDVRVIAATNSDLSEKVRAGEFREDLYYRLKVVEIFLPPLRERKEDIPLLVSHFIERFNNKFHKTIENASSEALECFMEYAWPGNIRELEHVIEYAFIHCNNRTITVSHLPQDLLTGQKPPARLLQTRQGDEAALISRALKKTGGNKAKAARLLGISRRTLYRMISATGIEQEDIS